MSEVILSDYFYGDESEQFIYFRIPRLLITSPRFKHLSTDAKLLYGMLLDRMSLWRYFWSLLCLWFGGGQILFLNAGTDGTVQGRVPPCGNLAGDAG